MKSSGGQSLWRGIAFMLIASVCAAMLSIMTAYTKFVPPAVVASAHIALPVLIVAAVSGRAVWTSILSRSLRPAFVRACCVAGGQILHVLALFEGQLAKVVLLHHISPLLIPVVAWIWLGEKISRLATIGLVLGFVGILIVLQPQDGVLVSFDFATTAALVSGLAATLSKVLLYDIARNYNQSARATFIQTFGMAAVLSLPFAVYALLSGGEVPRRDMGPIADHDDLMAVAMVAFGAMALDAVVDQLLTDRAYRLLPNAELIGPFMYAAVIFSMLFDWLFLGRVPGLAFIVGAGFIVIGATLAVMSVKREEGSPVAAKSP